MRHFFLELPMQIGALMLGKWRETRWCSQFALWSTCILFSILLLIWWETWVLLLLGLWGWSKGSCTFDQFTSVWKNWKQCGGARSDHKLCSVEFIAVLEEMKGYKEHTHTHRHKDRHTHTHKHRQTHKHLLTSGSVGTDPFADVAFREGAGRRVCGMLPWLLQPTHKNAL